MASFRRSTVGFVLLMLAACSSPSAPSSAPTLLERDVRLAWPSVAAASAEVVTVADNQECTPKVMVWYLPVGDGWKPELVGWREGPYEQYSSELEFNVPAGCGSGPWDLLVPELRGTTLVCDLVDLGCMRVEIQS